MSNNEIRKLHYFPLNARGGLIRAILYYKQVPFEDIKIPFGEWGNRKFSGDYEFNQLPMLESHGLKMVQTGAIILTLAREFGLLGNTLEEEYLNYSILFLLEEIVPKFTAAVFGLTPEAIAAIPQKAKEFLEIHAPYFLQKMEARFKQYSGKYAIGDTFTLSDIIFTYLITNAFKNPSRKETWEPVLLENAPTLAAHAEKIASNELAEYFSKGFIFESPF